MRSLALAVPLCAALAACGSEPAPDPTPTPTETIAGPRTLVASGFNDQQIGPKIAGPEGSEVESELTLDGRKVADLVSYVTCPAPADDEEPAEECVPGEMPEGTVYTYVHRVTPVETEDQLDAPIAFRTTRVAHGFANNIGYDREQGEAVLGDGYSIRVQEDNGALAWRVEMSDGWDAGEELTFFWQSTLPPEGPVEAYAAATENGRAYGTGPFPPAPEEVDGVSSGEEASID
ncbi:hypothetical protein [Aurantiacibacter poecillastricola]|uniref:hypothetical protein n=1 Tax=Aurantiacibacter poecillastricola TaxID=3064385 RepID=UPI00273E72AD|nr:hypothetical protein [Aurantiacibacter sp. 219JJ12-13]MDP5261945.1 hypothetical protein [Aurantiacibacter sp. 219JJ12-13]